MIGALESFQEPLKNDEMRGAGEERSKVCVLVDKLFCCHTCGGRCPAHNDPTESIRRNRS